MTTGRGPSSDGPLFLWMVGIDGESHIPHESYFACDRILPGVREAAVGSFGSVEEAGYGFSTGRLA